MSCTAIRNARLIRVHDGEGHGRAVGAGYGRGVAVESAQGIRRVVHAKGSEAEPAAKPNRRPHRVQAMADDVAHRNSDPSVTEVDGVVPVAAYVDATIGAWCRARTITLVERVSIPRRFDSRR